jgi:ABC-type Fe3+ transport system substrate-binding protein
MTTQARALERIKRIAEAQASQDADHFESDAMGYLAALRDEGLLPEAEYARLMNAARTERMNWRKAA